MKKSLVLMAMAGVALAGCVNDVAEVAQNQEQKEVKIAFDAPVNYKSLESRVNVLGEIGNHGYGTQGNMKYYQYPREENFIIYGIWDDEDPGFDGWDDSQTSSLASFNGTEISYISDIDAWAPLDANKDYYYWKDGEVLSYAAYSPADLQKIYKDGVLQDDPSLTNYNKEVVVAYGDDTSGMGLKITNFSTPAKANFHYDLMYSELVLNAKSTNMNHSAGYYSGAPILFKHALSSVVFSIKKDVTGAVYLRSIKLWGVKTQGDFNENITKPSQWGNTWVYANTPQWTPKDGTENEYSNAFIVYQIGGSSTGAEFTSSPQEVSMQMKAGDIYHQLFLIPQSLTDNVKIEVKYSYHANPSDEQIITKTFNLNNDAYKQDNTGQTVVDAWLPGNKYYYRLLLSESAIKGDRIMFSPSTDGWKEMDAVVIPL